MAKERNPKAPQGLDRAGQGLWKLVLGDLSSDWELTAVELHVVERAAQCADRIAQLEALIEADGLTTVGGRGQVVLNPCVSEARQWKLVETKLLASLELAPQPEPSAVQSRASKAASTRWAREKREKARARREA